MESTSRVAAVAEEAGKQFNNLLQIVPDSSMDIINKQSRMISQSLRASIAEAGIQEIGGIAGGALSVVGNVIGAAGQVSSSAITAAGNIATSTVLTTGQIASTTIQTAGNVVSTTVNAVKDLSLSAMHTAEVAIISGNETRQVRIQENNKNEMLRIQTMGSLLYKMVDSLEQNYKTTFEFYTKLLQSYDAYYLPLLQQIDEEIKNTQERKRIAKDYKEKNLISKEFRALLEDRQNMNIQFTRMHEKLLLEVKNQKILQEENNKFAMKKISRLY